MNVRFVRNVYGMESMRMSRVHPTDLLQPGIWSNEMLDHGIVDLYTRRMELGATRRERALQDAHEQMVITQPFGRPFTEQPPQLPESVSAPGGLAEWRQKLASATHKPRRRWATS